MTASPSVARSKESSPKGGVVAWAIPVAIVLAGVALRLFRLDHQSLWYDEIFSLAASGGSWLQMHALLVEDVVHPPLHYYILHAWMSFFGVTAEQARLVSVIFGALSVGALYLLAKELFNRRTAVIASILLAVSQIGIRYSQEARPYSMVLFLSIAASYFFLRSLRSGRASEWWISAALMAALIGTHYYGMFAAISLAVFGVMVRKRYPVPVVRWIGAAMLSAAVLGGWLATGVLREALRSPKMALEPASQHWYTGLTILNEFNNGRVDGFYTAAPWWTFAVGGVLFSLPALLALTRKKDGAGEGADTTAETFLAVQFCLPLVLGIVAGFVVNFQAVRYIGFAIAPYFILCARGLDRLKSPMIRAGILALAVGYSAYAMRAIYSIPYKEDHRAALAHVASHAIPGDCFVITPAEARQVPWVWSIYQPGLPPLKPTPLDAAMDPNSSCSRVWMIAVLKDNMYKLRWARTARQRLESAYSLASRQSFFWIDVSLYQREKTPAAR